MTAPQGETGARPVRLVLTDDLRRSRGTVFFRAIFAIPFLIWLGVWGVGAFCVAFVSWVATLFGGRTPEYMHNFLGRFVRYTTQIYSYSNLASEALPAFDGRPGYAVDLEIDPPERQNRWTVGFRAILAIPGLILASALVGTGSVVLGFVGSGGSFSVPTAIEVAVVLSWFYALARTRVPRGLRDLIAFGLAYAAQLWAYLFLLTDRYPSSDPLTAIGPLPTRSDPVRAEVTDPLRRSRLTVFFRLALAAPHLVFLGIWAAAAYAVAIVNWFATLFAGTSPSWAHRFLARYLRYQFHVSAFLYVVGNPFPGFVGLPDSYPIELHIADRAPQNRWAVAFRIVLAIPALLLAAALSAALLLVAVFGWFAGLFTGRMPLGLRNLGVFALRYLAQANAYLLILSEVYPYSGPCHEVAAAPPADPAPAALGQWPV